jgi:hypothetical protein
MTTPGGVAFQGHECSSPVPPATQPNPDAASPDWKPVIERPEPTVAPAICGGQLPPGYMVVPVVMQPCGLSCTKCTSKSSTSNGTTVTLYFCADPPSKRARPGPARAPADPPSSLGVSVSGPVHAPADPPSPSGVSVSGPVGAPADPPSPLDVSVSGPAGALADPPSPSGVSVSGPVGPPADPPSPLDVSVSHRRPSLPDSQGSNTSPRAATAEGEQCQNGETLNSNYNICAGYTGAAWTANGWPCDRVKKAFDQCDENSCRPDTIVAYSQQNVNCQGNGRQVVVFASFKGSYHGWEDRDRLIQAALETQNGQCGSNPVGLGWWIPTQITLRNYANGPWMNMDFKSVCQDGEVGRSVGDLSQTLASTLDWKAISTLEYVNLI